MIRKHIVFYGRVQGFGFRYRARHAADFGCEDNSGESGGIRIPDKIIAEKSMNCEDCNYYVYDEEYDDWYCTVDMDEDDYARLIQGHYRQCPYYRHEDDYQIVRHQM